MPQDAFTLRYLCEELNGIFVGGKINRIVQPTVDVTVFTVYTENGVKKLLLDVNPSCPRVCVAENEPPSDSKTSNFCMLLKKRLLSAKITGVSLVGFDRIVKIDVQPSSEFFDAPAESLYVELMGRYSNVILTENGKVLGGNRGINFLDNNVRPLIAGLPYKLPPVGDKKPPSDPALKTVFSAAEDITAEKICENVQGLALSTAQEIVRGFFGAENQSGASDGNTGERFFAYLNAFVYGTEKRPCVFYENGAAKDVCVYPYSTVNGEEKEFGFLYLAEEEYFGERTAKKRFKDLKDRLNAVVNAGLKKGRKRLCAVLSRLKDAESAEDNRIRGEMILANIYKLKGGEKTAKFDNYYDGGKIAVELDERLSPAQNAENYYKKYNKQKRALSSLIPQRESAEEEINYLESVSSEIALADDFSDLKAVEDELAALGLIRKRTVKKGAAEDNAPHPRVYDAHGFTVKAGRNNAENDRITFSAKPQDIWLHAKAYHSTHVIIETDGKKTPDRVLTAAAEICAYYSKGREGGKTEIVYCQRKFVKKPKRSKPGFCTYTDFKSVIVSPDAHADLLRK